MNRPKKAVFLHPKTTQFPIHSVLSTYSINTEFYTVQIDWTKYDEAKATDLAMQAGFAGLEEMKLSIHSMGLVKKGILLKSLKMAVRKKAGLVERIEVRYEFYGKFFVHGANNLFGKGVDLPIRDWRSMAMETSQNLINQSFAEFYADLIAQEIEIVSVKLKM